MQGFLQCISGSEQYQCATYYHDYMYYKLEGYISGVNKLGVVSLTGGLEIQESIKVEGS